MYIAINYYLNCKQTSSVGIHLRFQGHVPVFPVVVCIRRFIQKLTNDLNSALHLLPSTGLYVPPSRRHDPKPSHIPHIY